METHEQIRSRILRAAARQWGYQESDMDLEAFDPLVRLLVEACAGEVARLERTLVDSETRILERMLEQLTPEVLTGPLPAHGMAFLRALSGTETVTPELQCYATVERRKEKLPVYFSPLLETEVVNGSVACLELGGEHLYRIGEDLQRERIAAGTPGLAERGSTLWLGVELDTRVTSVAGLRFYFNWLNAARLTDNLEWLRRADWSCGGRPLRVVPGMVSATPHDRGEVASLLQREYSHYQRTAAGILQYYAPHLATVTGFAEGPPPEDLRELMRTYPPEFEAHYRLEDLAALDRKLLWIRVAFPTQLTRQEVQSTTCALNAIPVANLRRHQAEGRMRDQVNIIPLDTESFYFDTLTVRNRNGMAYDEVPLTNIRSYRAGQYSIRRRDTGKFGEREAARSLLGLLDVLRDESAAFSAYGKDSLVTKVTALNQQLKDLEQQVNERGGSGAGLAFLVASPLVNDRYLDVTYLSTRAEDGNGIIAGQTLDLHRFAGVDRKSMRLLTSTTGGRAPLSSQERKYAYKKAIISRGRIVSREDIRAFCQAALGDLLTGEIVTRKGFAYGTGPESGLAPELQIGLELATPPDADAAGKLESRLAELERELNFYSAGVLPIRVVTGTATPAQPIRP
ncbi:type VI secretion system baseplate subunit TssF [Lewinella sp. IMCC34183]|uniref:type VI secretion system baseplate subunit TssF n=1 Tax=Lewinella sp. IMCC34183 TaxID=2248762 RepID=UPI000E25A36A|nr:type VI secretion system baseplate subunit TssF [Lewinella sp. IMCC34183]